MSTAGILGVSLGGLLSTGTRVWRGGTRGGSGAQSWKMSRMNHNNHEVTVDQHYELLYLSRGAKGRIRAATCTYIIFENCLKHAASNKHAQC